MRCQHWIPLAVVALLSAAILGHLWLFPPNLAAWPRCEYFRCSVCSGAAVIDPHQPERWGCQTCEFSTFQVADRFHVATVTDFHSRRLFELAMIAAGGIEFEPSLEPHTTPVTIWVQGGGKVERETQH
jgi:hypothetical protein